MLRGVLRLGEVAGKLGIWAAGTAAALALRGAWRDLRGAPPGTWGAILLRRHGDVLGNRLRELLVDLGPAFVKFGQVASTRIDLFPRAMIQALAELQDEVPPFSYAEVRRTVEAEFGAPPEAIFAEFDPVPIASASLGQVHRARLADGREVAVKVRRPHIEEAVERDLAVIRFLVAWAERLLPAARKIALSEKVEEFGESLRRELDYVREGNHADLLRSALLPEAGVKIPAVIWERTTERVLTLEYVRGEKLKDFLARPPQTSEERAFRKTVAVRLVRTIVRQMFRDGVFHADPHPGNVFVHPDGTLTLIDFGMVGRLPERLRDGMALLVVGLMQKDTDTIVRAVRAMQLLPPSADLAAYRADVDRLREKYYHRPFHTVSVPEVLDDLLGLALRHDVEVPRELTLMGRALGLLEGIAVRLDPELRLVDLAEPIGIELLLHRLSPPEVYRRARVRLEEDLALVRRALTALAALAPDEEGASVGRPRRRDRRRERAPEHLGALDWAILSLAFVQGAALLFVLLVLLGTLGARGTLAAAASGARVVGEAALAAFSALPAPLCGAALVGVGAVFGARAALRIVRRK
ncbi:ABC1 kinase family protein [Brockia lithotrophica]|uniref:Ubiquinone biosynthesis protein n=1 Tax=Brockia lithotrophica TaxID=933949 RepID=A0A660KWQ5_9BACL|nr:AarF/ABC1/UbiB kinase family protein [Brockia lithotrophica]RKQ84158.1 ubiquinone biosynthesis protein [Brockia lithotrophica]